MCRHGVLAGPLGITCIGTASRDAPLSPMRTGGGQVARKMDRIGYETVRRLCIHTIDSRLRPNSATLEGSGALSLC